MKTLPILSVLISLNVSAFPPKTDTTLASLSVTPRTPSKTLLDESFKTPAMVLIQGGAFSMGSTIGDEDEKPLHRVTVTDFYLGKYEVTVQEFRKFVEDTSYETDAERKCEGSYFWNNGLSKWILRADVNWRYDAQGNLLMPAMEENPVLHVSWNDAMAYCKWISLKTGQKYTLPTEAQWEYAAGNGNAHDVYSWGEGLPTGKKSGNIADAQSCRKYPWAVFNAFDDNNLYTASVGTYDANTLGLYDMTGNVWEWCLDWYDAEYYKKSPNLNPVNLKESECRVVRGGAWCDGPYFSRTTYRDVNQPFSRVNVTGFRLCISDAILQQTAVISNAE